ncbi:MAG: glycoside hydrolase family 57 protein [Halanaerobiales bacterium]
MSEGFLLLVLHAHLPFVPENEEKKPLAEEWLFEAITETYIPLLNLMNRLRERNIDFSLTLNISPPLAAMLSSQLMQNKYLKHLEKLIELTEKEVRRTKYDSPLNEVAKLYRYLFKEAHYIFHKKYKDNLLTGFRELQDSGCLEIITSAATHSYLPLVLTEESISAQISTGVKSYQHHFGKQPPGLWLPECGFKPEISPLLAANELKYFFSSHHGLIFARPRPRYGVFAPLYTPEGVAVFGRDRESGKQVWSADEGYPGDYNYREFYRDIGFELDYNYLKDYLPRGERKHLGIKYYKITGKTENKDIYRPEAANKKAREHAENFLFNRQQQVKYLADIMDRPPVITAPYDAELFGHWWFEGPQWLEHLLKKIALHPEELKTITASQYLNEYSKNQVAVPAESSWGYRGYHEVWLNGNNDWIYRHLHEAELKIKDLSARYSDLTDKNSILYRTLTQMGRELMLAQSSDWAFIMKADTVTEYAEERTRGHLDNFFNLASGVDKKNIDRNLLKRLEVEDNIFPFIDYKVYLPAKNRTEIVSIS